MKLRSAWGGSNWEQTDGKGYDRFRDLGEYLSSEERTVLKELGQSSMRPRSSTRVALRLLSLGLAELSCGRLALTRAGQSVLASMPHSRTPSRGGCAGAAVERDWSVPAKKSLTQRTIVCLECGRGFRALKRHLALAHGMTPDKYRSRWKLPNDHPMVAPLHSRKRQYLAKQIGLGHVARRHIPMRKNTPKFGN